MLKINIITLKSFELITQRTTSRDYFKAIKKTKKNTQIPNVIIRFSFLYSFLVKVNKYLGGGVEGGGGVVIGYTMSPGDHCQHLCLKCRKKDILLKTSSVLNTHKVFSSKSQPQIVIRVHRMQITPSLRVIRKLPIQFFLCFCWDSVNLSKKIEGSQKKTLYFFQFILTTKKKTATI